MIKRTLAVAGSAALSLPLVLALSSPAVAATPKDPSTNGGACVQAGIAAVRTLPGGLKAAASEQSLGASLGAVVSQHAAKDADRSQWPWCA